MATLPGPGQVAAQALTVLGAEVHDELTRLPDSSRASRIPSPESFLTVLQAHLEAVRERLETSTQTEANICGLLANLERLATWPNRFKTPSIYEHFSLGFYPRLRLIFNNPRLGRQQVRDSIAKLARSTSREGILTRTALCKNFKKFASAETPPHGSELYELRGASKPLKPDAEGNASECLHKLHAALCRLARCPGDRGQFKANVSLNFASGPTESGGDAVLNMYLLHYHVEGGRASRDWRQTRICAVAQRSAINFRQVENQARKEITELCTLVRDGDPSLVKLNFAGNSLFQEGLEVTDGLTLRESSVSLARLLASADMRNDPQRRLLLSCLLAKATWKFYDLDWMGEYWTRDAVRFMRQRLIDIQAQQQIAPLSHQPFLLADLRSPTSSAGMTPRTAAERAIGRTHILPGVLALGIVLLEIELGRPVIAHEDEGPADTGGSKRANAAHNAVSLILQSKDWKNRKIAYRPLVDAIEICIKPDTSKLDPGNLRHSLYKAVVQPLCNLFSVMWLDGKQPSETLETFNPGPIDFDEPDAPYHSEFPDFHGTQDPPALGSPPPLPSLGEEDDRVGETRGDGDDGSVFGAEDGQIMSEDLCNQADKWVGNLKSMRQIFGVGREAQRIKIAILDTGADANHWGFRDNRIVECKSFVDGGNAGVDALGHGTQIADIILNLTTNVELYVAQVTDSRLSVNRDQIAKALYWARTEWKVNMITMSFGYHSAGGPDTVKLEVEKCLNDKIVVFASASNDGANKPRTYPGRYDRVLCIHSATGLGRCSDFNPTAELGKRNFTVLGEGIKSFWPGQREGSGRDRRVSGTSFATPVAVSVAAFAIGYIRRKLSDLDWNTDPMSPEGVRVIFEEISEGNQRGGYDVVCPERFFRHKEPALIREVLKNALGGYPVTRTA